MVAGNVWPVVPGTDDSRVGTVHFTLEEVALPTLDSSLLRAVLAQLAPEGSLLATPVLGDAAEACTSKRRQW